MRGPSPLSGRAQKTQRSGRRLSQPNCWKRRMKWAICHRVVPTVLEFEVAGTEGQPNPTSSSSPGRQETEEQSREPSLGSFRDEVSDSFFAAVQAKSQILEQPQGEAAVLLHQFQYFRSAEGDTRTGARLLATWSPRFGLSRNFSPKKSPGVR